MGGDHAYAEGKLGIQNGNFGLSDLSGAVVVGGGIGGAVCALALSRSDWRVTVVERQTRSIRVSRPEGLWNRTLDALDRLEIGSLIRSQAAVPIRGVESRLGGRLLATISEGDFAAAGAAMYSTDPGDVRRMILDAAVATGKATVLRGAEVTELLRDGDRVVGVRARHGTVPAEHRGLVVGDDGAHSVVRGGLGIPISLRTFPLELVTFEFARPPSLRDDRILAWLNPQGIRSGLVVAGFFPAPGSILKGILGLPLGLWEARFLPSADALWRDLAVLTPLADDMRQVVGFPDGFTLVRRPYGHAAAYARSGAVLIGDAAHPMSPVGGQGANCAIWDGLALADALLGNTEGRALESYQRLRYRANARSVALTEWGAWAMWIGRRFPLLTAILPAVAPVIGRSTWAKRTLLSRVARAFVSD
jgi:2-polyprenyl-6-methoxyphenol hydroxylase-like FAD-dependent oxidoreductase